MARPPLNPICSLADCHYTRVEVGIPYGGDQGSPSSEAEKGCGSSDRDAPDGNQEAAPLFVREPQLGMLMADCASIVLPMGLVAFVIAMLRLDGQPIHEPTLKAWQNTINVIATVFPILFASVVGRMVYEAARWKLEQGAAMGSLEQLVGSRTVGSTFLTQLHLRQANPLGISLLFLWVFSPIGSQSILRALGSSLEQHVEPSTVVCLDSNARSLLGQMLMNVGRSESVAREVIFTHLASMFNALLFTPFATKTEPMDIWSNVRVPALSLNNAKDWHDVSGPPDLEFYSALAGVPVANISVGNTTFSIESSYIDLQCTNISRGEKVTELEFEWDDDGAARPNGTWHGLRSSRSESPPWSIAIDRFVDDYWANWTTVNSRFGSSFDTVRLILNSPRLFENDTDAEVGPTNLLFQASILSPFSDNITGVRAICGVVQQYVESRVMCSRSSLSSQPHCTVTAQRASRLSNPPAGVTFLSFPETWKWLSSRLPQAAGQGLNTADPVLRYLDDPRLNSVWGTEYSLLDEIDPHKFSRRLEQIVNTYMLLSQAFNAARDTNTAKSPLFERNATVPAEVSEDVTVYIVSRLWMALFLLSCAVLLVSGAVSAVLAHLTVGPEVLGYASTVVRDSKFIELPPETGRMQGIDVTRMMRGQRIRYGVTHLVSRGQPLVGVGLEDQTERLGLRAGR